MFYDWQFNCLQNVILLLILLYYCHRLQIQCRLHPMFLPLWYYAAFCPSFVAQPPAAWDPPFEHTFCRQLCPPFSTSGERTRHCMSAWLLLPLAALAVWRHQLSHCARAAAIAWYEVLIIVSKGSVRMSTSLQELAEHRTVSCKPTGLTFWPWIWERDFALLKHPACMNSSAFAQHVPGALHHHSCLRAFKQPTLGPGNAPLEPVSFACFG